MYGVDQDFRLRHGSWVECGSAPGDVDRKSREIDQATVATVAAQVVGSTHENAIHGAGFDTQSTKHAFAVVDGKPGDLESFATFHTFFANVNAIDRAKLCALVASDARGEIEPMEPSVPRGDRNG